MDMRAWLVLVAALLWLEVWIGTAVAIRKGLPYGVGGEGNPDDVWGDFVQGGGTALSPPLVIVVLFGILILLATRTGWPGRLGAAGLTLLAILFLVTILGEPMARQVMTPSDMAFPETLLVAFSLVSSVLMLVFGTGTVLNLRKPSFASR
jgi:hypothetical protein